MCIRDSINAARKYGAAVNIIDRPEFCDFQFGAIVNRSPLVIGVSTDGASPALGQQIRARLEAMFPPAITKWLKAAQNLRPIIKKRELDFGTRRNFWHNFAKQALENPNSKPDEAHLIAQIDHAQPITVSYTHLDVYKRQASSCNEGILPIKAAISTFAC